jgi:hypothetical protein
MTNISVHTLARTNAPERPRLIDTARSRIPWRPSPAAPFGRLRALVQRRSPYRRPKPDTQHQRPDELLINLFSAPQGAGVIGPGAPGLERAALIEALTCKEGIAQVVIENADFVRLVGHLAEDDLQALGDRIYLAEVLEDAIEHIESTTKSGAAIEARDHPPASAPIAWFARPGQDADVVHEILQTQRDPNVVTLITGPWAYGPTHYIETDGPRRLPRRPIELPSAQEAITALRAHIESI